MTDSARPFEGLTLAVAAPSRQWVTNEGGIDWALRRRAFSAAEALGFRVRELEGTYLEEARFAGPDAVRAGDLTCALTELDADLVMAMGADAFSTCSTGSGSVPRLRPSSAFRT